MAGGTHAFDMIKRMKQNESLRKLPYFKRKQQYAAVEKELGINYKTASADEREVLRKKIVRRRARDNRSTMKMLVVLSLFAILVVVLLLKFFLGKISH